MFRPPRNRPREGSCLILSPPGPPGPTTPDAMRRFATLALAVLALVPAAFAQRGYTNAAPALTLAPSGARTALADTLVIANVEQGAALAVYSYNDGSGIVTGTNTLYTVFGSGYTLPNDEDYVVLGVATAFFDIPTTNQTFDVSVFNGTLEDGPQGEALYTETFDTDSIVPPETGPDGTTVIRTFFDFAEEVEVGGPVFFITYDFGGITEDLSIVSTADLDVTAPETVIFDSGEWFLLEDIFQDPLEVYLLADAVVLTGEVEPIAVGTARDQGDGATVTVQGTVTRSAGAFTYLQDETGGLTIRQTSGAFFDAVASGAIRPGSVVRVTGTLSQFNGLLQISGGALEDFEVVGTAEVPAPQDVTLAELAANGEAYEGELVRVFDVTFPDESFQFEAATTYTVTDPSDDSGAVTVRVPNADDGTLDGGDFFGNPAIVTGVVGQFSSTDPDAGYQILVTQYGDVGGGAVATDDDPDGRLGLSLLAPNPAAGTAEATVTLAAPGRATLAVYDVLGREVARVLDRDLAVGAHVVRLDASGLPAGTYLVRLSAAGATAARPFTVAR